MLTVIRDEQGNIEAACEWVPTNNKGIPTNPEDGANWIFVNDIEVGTGRSIAIAKVILEIASKFPQATHAYWNRCLKENTGRIHQFSVPRLVSRANKMLRIKDPIRW